MDNQIAVKLQSVAVVLPSLIGGGAERVAINLANHWSQQGRTVTLVTVDRCDESRYSILAGIQRVGLNMMIPSRSRWSAVRNNLARVARLRRALRATDATVVVSFTDVTNVTTLLACRGTGLPVVVCERTDPRHQAVGRMWQWLRQRTYGRSAALVVQTESVRRWAESRGWHCPLVVIPNAAPDRLPRTAHAARNPAVPTIVGLGRLSEEKGFHLLIEAYSRIASRFPEWQLAIFGEGRERNQLERQISELGIAARVHLPGWTMNPEAALAEARIFVLPSRYEGFPNALLEAMAAGLPCVSFDCDSGPREIIRDGVDGLLVPPGDVGALAETLARLMNDPPLCERLSAEASQVTARYSRHEFYCRWDAVLDGAVPRIRPET